VMPKTAVATLDPYYLRERAFVFPMVAGSKSPIGIVGSWKLDCSNDAKQIAAWQTAHPGCNWGVVAYRSGWITADIDTSGGPEGREAAWQEWCTTCTEWGIAPPIPQTESARGGWHCHFKIPEDVAPDSLRQTDLKKGRINLRCVGFTVAAGSYYDGTAKGEQSGRYTLVHDAEPYPAPDGLIAHCTRPAAIHTPTAAGDRDVTQTTALVAFLADRGEFDDYQSWVECGMALKIALGDAGFDVWALTHNADVSDDLAAAKWNSFAKETTSGKNKTIGSLIDRAKKLGGNFSVSKSTASMFEGVAAIAAAAGASLGGPQGMPMMAGQLALTDIGLPIIATVPLVPALPGCPQIPDAARGHGLFASLNSAIPGLIANPNAYADTLAILSLVHVDTYEAVRRACPDVDTSAVKISAERISTLVARKFVKFDNWRCDHKNVIEHNNPDNVRFFLHLIGAQVRFNGWLERIEITGHEWSDWTYVDDNVVAALRTRALETGTRFQPAREFFWETLIADARKNAIDPALETLAALEATWDGTPRLVTWLTAACGVPCDPYHQAVGRSIIGGMVRRIRQPGCKFDLMPVFYGPQGTGKSTMIAALAPNRAWFTDAVLLGDASKELVLSLAGRALVEISEMGMRGSANPNHVKAMISRQTDMGRTAYARAVTERPRRNIFCGSTNDDSPLQDPTGNRRFMPVHVSQEINMAWLRANIGQLIGEAAALESQGATFDLPRDVWSIAAEHQESAVEETDISIRLQEWFAEGPHAAAAYIRASDLVTLSDGAGWTGKHKERGAAMRKLGFKPISLKIEGKQGKIWARTPAEMRPVDIQSRCIRYMVGTDAQGRPLVRLSSGGEIPPTPPRGPGIPPPPLPS
jgi:predicted P-loop ATPase